MQQFIRYGIAFLLYTVFAQQVSANDDIIQLRYKISHLKTPQEKIDTAWSLVDKYQDTPIELYLLEVVETYAHELKDRNKECQAIRNTARNVFNTTMNVDSLKILFGKLDRLKYTNNAVYRKCHIELRSFICYAYIAQNQFSSIINIAGSIFKDAEKTNDDYSRAVAYEIMAIINQGYMQFEPAAKYMEKAYETSKSDNENFTYSMQLLFNLMDIYIISKNYAALEPHLKSAYKYIARTQKEYPDNMYISRYNLILDCANVLFYLSQNDIKECEKYFIKLKDYPQTDEVYTDILLRITKAKFYLAKGYYNEAYEYVKDDKFMPGSNLLFSETRIEVFKELGMKDECIVAQDSLMSQYRHSFNIQFVSEFNEMKTKYEMSNMEKNLTDKQFRLSRIVRSSFFVIACLVLVILVYMVYRIINYRKDKREFLRSDKMRTSFLQNVNHEMRTPLNAISGFLQILTDPELRNHLSKDELVEYGNIVRNNTRYMTTLINDILSTSQLIKGDIKISTSLYPVNEICKNAFNSVFYNISENVNFYMTTDAADDFKIHTDHLRVEQILVNFLRNSIKYTSNGEIHLHCSISENPGRVTFSVEDTGSSIPVEDGMGFGLNVCQRLSSILHGEVKQDTSYTKGTRFILIL